MTDLVNELERYYRTIQPGDLLGKYVLRTFDRRDGRNKDGKIDPVVLKLNELLVHTGDRTGSGLISFKEIVKSLKNIFDKRDINELHQKVRIFHDEVLLLPDADRAYFFKDEKKRFTMGSILSIDSSKSESRKFGVIMSSTPMISLPVRDVNKVSLFMNTIPTLEMSKCLPYLDIKFQFKRSETNTDTEVLRTPSLLKFLNGGLELSKAGSADQAMFRASQDEEEGSYCGNGAVDSTANSLQSIFHRRNCSTKVRSGP